MGKKVKILANRYEIEKIAGKGGTSVVYKAYDLQAERAVRAIKEISKANREVYEMAKQESALIKELYEADQSNAFFPNIIHRFETDKNFYIVQDYLDGESMEAMLEAGPMPYKMFLEAAKQICSFMKFFHDTGRVLSDMKPENIMVLKPSKALTDNEANIKLKFIDFGTAIKNATGVTGYTPEYASPEQYRQLKLDERTDVYNMGATFYHMIQGKKPLRVDNENRMMTSQERFQFDKTINADVKRIIQKCVADDPEKRYRSCDTVYRDLCRIERSSSVRLMVLCFLLSVISFCGAGFSAYMSHRLEQQSASEQYTANVNKGSYADAIRIDHTNKDGIYSKLIQSFTEDSKLDADEDNFIVNEIKSLDSIKETDSDYGMCMYEIANAYWLYYYPYEDETDSSLSEDEISEENKRIESELEKKRINASYEWFEKAVNSEDLEENAPDSYKRAVIFSGICKFYADIDRMEKEGTDSAQFYSDMWKSIEEMSVYINENNEVVSVRVCQTLLSLISRYSAKFMQNGVRESSQQKILDSIAAKVYRNGDITYSNNYARSIAEAFDMEAVELKLEMAYAE
ncbi:MAG: serine/threonine protein kinase [Ruminococcus sp.]|nr:serine/threonine protein kinase [Ruminococcus sp.]